MALCMLDTVDLGGRSEHSKLDLVAESHHLAARFRAEQDSMVKNTQPDCASRAHQSACTRRQYLVKTTSFTAYNAYVIQ